MGKSSAKRETRVAQRETGVPSTRRFCACWGGEALGKLSIDEERRRRDTNKLFLCRAYGARALFHAYPALPGWATFVSRFALDSRYIVCTFAYKIHSVQRLIDASR